MNSMQELIARTRYFVPSLDELEERLAEEPETTIARIFSAEEQVYRTRSIVDAETISEEVANEINDADERLRRRFADAGRNAIRKIRLEGENAVFEPDEASGLEAISIAEGRPAIFIQDGRFFPPPPTWEILNEVRGSIERVCRSVGRIEVSGHPNRDWVGTGFLVAEDVVMTNRHVAKEFCWPSSSLRWVFEPGMVPCIDYAEELGALTLAEFAFTDVLGIHERFDIALLRVSRQSQQGGPSPVPLTLAAEEPDPLEHRKVYVIGYPAWDPIRNDPETMRRLFSNIYGVKRLQPGEIREVFIQDSLFHHDCTTLGGNSGSCVTDLETGQVIGLHFGGRYLKTNKAVALWTLRDDPMLRQAGVRFD